MATPALQRSTQRPVIDATPMAASIQSPVTTTSVSGVAPVGVPMGSSFTGSPPRSDLTAYANPISLESTKVDDLVVASSQEAVFNRMINRVKMQDKLLKEWTFASRGGNQPGINFLFQGGEGLGKTTAVRVLAKRLNRPLYELDLGKVMGDSTAETMNRLTAAFEAAAQQKAILMISHANVFFERGDRDDQTREDRLISAHLETLLGSHSGVVAMTTTNGVPSAVSQNLTDELNLSWPEYNEKLQIWKKAMPPGAPNSDIDFDKLANLPLTGGNIAAAVLNAASEAAAAGTPITLDLLKAAINAGQRREGRMGIPESQF
jgi:AAA+ superfamily predicted ATPase